MSTPRCPETISRMPRSADTSSRPVCLPASNTVTLGTLNAGSTPFSARAITRFISVTSVMRRLKCTVTVRTLFEPSSSSQCPTSLPVRLSTSKSAGTCMLRENTPAFNTLTDNRLVSNMRSSPTETRAVSCTRNSGMTSSVATGILASSGWW